MTFCTCVNTSPLASTDCTLSDLIRSCGLAAEAPMHMYMYTKHEPAMPAPGCANLQIYCAPHSGEAVMKPEHVRLSRRRSSWLSRAPLWKAGHFPQFGLCCSWRGVMF